MSVSREQELEYLNEIVNSRSYLQPSKFRPNVIRFPLNGQMEGYIRYYEELEREGLISLHYDKATMNLVATDRERLEGKHSRAVIRNLHNDGEPAEVMYNPHSGRLIINGKRVYLHKKYKKTFTLLFNNANKPVSKEAFWRAAGHRENPDLTDANDKYDINSQISNLRRALKGISPKQVRQSKGILELWAYIKLTDENDVI